jgi:hypothetical protein
MATMADELSDNFIRYMQRREDRFQEDQQALLRMYLERGRPGTSRVDEYVKLLLSGHDPDRVGRVLFPSATQADERALLEKENKRRQDEGFSLGLTYDQIPIYRRVPVVVYVSEEPEEMRAVTDAARTLFEACDLVLEDDPVAKSGSWLKFWHLRTNTPFTKCQLDSLTELISTETAAIVTADSEEFARARRRALTSHAGHLGARRIKGDWAANEERIRRQEALAGVAEKLANTRKLLEEGGKLSADKYASISTAIDTLSKAILRLGLASSLVIGTWSVAVPSSANHAAKPSIKELAIEEIQKIIDGDFPATLIPGSPKADRSRKGQLK